MPRPSVKPVLEPLEMRYCPSVADVIAFEQQIPALHASWDAAIPPIQAGLQTALNGIESQVPTWPPAKQLQAMPALAELQFLVGNFPAIAEAWFTELVTNEANVLLAKNDGSVSAGSPPQQQTVYVYEPSLLPIPQSPPVYHPLLSPPPPAPPEPSPEPEPMPPDDGALA